MPNQLDVNAGDILANSILGNSVPLQVGYANVTGAKPDADYSLLSTEYCKRVVKLAFTGWTTGRNVIVPTTTNGTLYVVINATGQTVTVKTSGGTGVVIANGKTAIVFEDGTNVVRITADNP